MTGVHRETHIEVHAGNRLETLAARLAERILEDPVDPLEPERIVVPHPTLGRWLTLELAKNLGVAAHQCIELPAQFAWSIMREAVPTLPREQPFAPERLRWRVFEALGDLGDGPEGPLHRYLADGDARKRFELASRLARVYDRCLLYRPDWIRDWERGDAPHWQAGLWQRLTRDEPGPRHWVAAIDAFREVAQSRPARWPRRVSFFGIGMLSPSYLDVLRHAGADMQIHLFLLSPCRQYWSDIAPKRVIRRRAEPLEPAADYRIEGNELLAALGKPARDMQALLSERELALGAPEEFYDDPPATTVLGQVQDDILDLRMAAAGATLPGGRAAPDSSLQIHACHSAMREAEVLHDRLLALFDEHSDVQPANVLVLTPSLQEYGGAIESVFATAGRIPFHVARPPAADTRAVRAFLDLLALPGSRYGAEAVLAPLECASVRARVGIPEERLASVRDWVRSAGIRWGVDGGHRREEGLPATEGHAWRLGLRRLLLGYAMDGGDDVFEGIAPCPIRNGALEAGSEDFEALGRFARYCDAAFALRGWLMDALVPGEWCARLRDGIVGTFFAGDARGSELRDRHETAALLRLIDEFETQCQVDTPIPWRVLRDALGEAANLEGRAVARLADGVTVAALGAGQAFPAEIVCAVGMNDRSFPRSPAPPTFDVLAADEERRGDRNVRDEDRFAFLEALLSARRAFLVTYTGRGLRDDAPIPPSVVVDELREYLARRFGAEEFEARHPLQPFSRRYFDGSAPALFSYAENMLEAAAAIGGGAAAGAPSRFAHTVAPVREPEATLDLDTLARFFGAPAKSFLQTRLRMRLEVEEVALAEEEPFELDGLGRWQLRDRMWALHREGMAPRQVSETVAAEPGLPEAAMGHIAVADAAGALAGLDVAMGEHAAALAAAPIDLDLPCDGLRLTGTLEGVDAKAGYLLWSRIGSIRPKDRIDAWLKLLAWTVWSGDLITGYQACLVGLGNKGLETRWLQAPPASDSAGLLQSWVEAWRRGQTGLLPFAPQSSWAYADALAKHGRGAGDAAAHERAMRAARNTWSGGRFAFAEADDSYAALAYDGDSPLGDDFAALARELLLPLVRAQTEERP